MFHRDKKYFTSKEVDQQIERYQSGGSSGPEEQATQRTIQKLQRVYQIKSDEHALSLERVWQRVLSSEEKMPASSAASHEQEATQQSGIISRGWSNGQYRGRGRVRHSLPFVAQLATILSLALIVGSFVLISQFVHPRWSVSQNGAGMSSGLYAYQNQTIYRLDNKTHRIVWKHTFANNETVTAGNSLDEKPFAVGGTLYVATQDPNIQDKLYVYALSVTNGSVLWRQLSATRVFVNSTVVYTLVESTTTDSSTLTARDRQTGKQLWQRQYPIVGAKGDPGRGKASTEGFRLVAVTDQILYAVASYSQHGQTIFTRYGLSPKDGSITWQNSEVIAGRMPTVEAKIVDGVIYTTEYNLKPVSPHIDAHGMTITEIPQSRAAAYDAATGKRRWQTPEMAGEQPNGGFSPAVSGSLLYYQTFNNTWPATAQQPNSITTLHALRVKDGAVSWQYQAKEESMTSTVLEGNSLYFETSLLKTVGQKQDLQLNVVALSAQTGAKRWSTPVRLLDGTEKTPTPAQNSPDPYFSSGYAVDMTPVASQQAVYYSTPGSRVYMLQPSDGKILGQFWVDKTNQTTVMDRAVLFVEP